LLDEAESYQLSLFEDTESQISFYCSVYSGSARGPISGFIQTVSDASGVSPWQPDLNGFICLEMMTGSIALESVEIYIAGSDGVFHQQTYMVPEVAQCSLLFWGFAAITSVWSRSHCRCIGQGATNRN
jgi:hypothetical protein